MHVLFIHQAFPAQFGRLALELTRRYGWRCSFLIEHMSSCPTPSAEMLERLEIERLVMPESHRLEPLPPWPQMYGRWLEGCQAVCESLRARPDWRPDLVVAHGGRGPLALFLPEQLDCPIVNYCEYCFAHAGSDLSYRVDLPPAEPAHFFPRAINAPVLMSLLAAHAGYAPTHWQRLSFPARFRHKIEVYFDGIDTDVYRPGPRPGDLSNLLGGRSIGADTRVVTYVSRGLESMRGFDLFMRLAARIARERSDVVFVVVGGEQIHYGWDKLHTGHESFKQWVLSQDDYDLERFVFIEHAEPDQLAVLLARSDLHVYLTVPFVLSWSMINAMSCGCVVLGSDVPPVRELIEPARSGFVEPFFDTERQLVRALEVLANPAEFRALGLAARMRVEEQYSIDACVPKLKDYFERMAAREKPRACEGSNG